MSQPSATQAARSVASSPARARLQARAPRPSVESTDVLLHLQQTAGNAAVVRSLNRAPHAEGLVAAPGEDLRVDETSEGTPSHVERLEGVDSSSSGMRQAHRTRPPEALWAGGPEAIARPGPLSWGQVQAAGELGVGAPAIPGPSPVSLDKIQKADGFNANRLGWTSFPIGSFKAPSFDFNSFDKTAAKAGKAAKGPTGGKGPTKGKAPKAAKAPAPAWYATPKLTTKAYEGDSVCWYLPAGTHKTTHVEAGKPVFWVMPPAMAAKDSIAEGEHSKDIKRAYELSLKEAQRVLDKHVVGATFGPKATKAAAEKLVLDTIQGKLAYPKLGSDKTKWGTTYDTLYRLTLQRDNKGWHTFGLGNKKTDKAGNVTYTVNKGTTNVGTVPSTKIVKY